MCLKQVASSIGGIGYSESHGQHELLTVDQTDTLVTIRNRHSRDDKIVASLSAQAVLRDEQPCQLQAELGKHCYFPNLIP